MSQLVESNQDGATGQISTRVEDAFDIYFKIHQKVNARSEEIQKSYRNNIIVNFSDIKELHQKTMQSIASLKPAKSAVGIRIAIAHNEGESERFNTFEAFEQHNTTSPNPTSVVNMVYTFTLFDVETETFENYKITNQLRSRIAELKQIEAEAPPFIPKSIINSMVTTTAKIVVEYTDYVKARHFTAMFDEWIKGCDESPSSKIANELKKHSHYIPSIGKLLIYAALALFTVGALEKGVITSESAVKFLVAYASAFVIAGGISNIFLVKLEQAIDSNISLSYLNLNKGDAKLSAEFQKRKKSALTSGILGAIGTIAVGVTTKLAYDLIVWIIH